ncbi:MAG: hypothetical protein WBH47_22190 [Streptosporangiaceae bacterium]
MTSKVQSERLAAQVAHLSADIDARDRGVIDAGLTASEALALAEGLRVTLEVALRATESGVTAEGSVSFGDPVVARMQAARRKAEARRQRIAASGFTLITGTGGAS